MLAAASARSALPAVVVVVEEEEEEENAALVAAAHELRRSLTPPHQSLFRVVCILVYEDSAGKLHRITGECTSILLYVFHLTACLHAPYLHILWEAVFCAVSCRDARHNVCVDV